MALALGWRIAYLRIEGKEIMQNNHPYEWHNHNGKTPVLILCDHASNHVPASVNGGDLGLPPADMQRHIAYDIGAAAVARQLSDMLNAPSILTKFSRLVIDPNRGEDDPTLLMKLYDGSVISGNRHADIAERERRLNSFYRPYHTEITEYIDEQIAEGRVPPLISIHSFTPQLNGRPKRPWHIGVLWDKDPRLAVPLIDFFREDPDVVVGDNEPYSGELAHDTLNRHGTQRGLPHVLIELRHDLIATKEGQFEWAERLAAALWTVLDTLEPEG